MKDVTCSAHEKQFYLNHPLPYKNVCLASLLHILDIIPRTMTVYSFYFQIIFPFTDTVHSRYNSMKYSNSWNSNRFSESQEISVILYNQKAEESSCLGVFLLKLPTLKMRNCALPKHSFTIYLLKRQNIPKKTWIFINTTLRTSYLPDEGSSLCSQCPTLVPILREMHPVLISIVLKGTQPTFFPICNKPGFIPIQNSRQNYRFLYFNIYAFSGRGKDITFWIEW